MTDLDIPALKAAALAAKGNRLYLDVLLEMLDPAAVLALIERLERAEASNALKRPDTLTVGQTFWTEQDGVRTSPVLVVVEQSRLEKLEAVAKAAKDLGLETVCITDPPCGDCRACRFQLALAALEAAP